MDNSSPCILGSSKSSVAAVGIEGSSWGLRALLLGAPQTFLVEAGKPWLPGIFSNGEKNGSWIHFMWMNPRFPFCPTW